MKAAMVSFGRALHVGLTVRDMDKAPGGYQRVLGFRLVRKFDSAPGAPGEPGVPRILLMHPDSGILVGLDNQPDRSRDRFSPYRTGMDHLALEVADEAGLAGWAGELDSLGVDHSPIRLGPFTVHLPRGPSRRSA